MKTVKKIILSSVGLFAPLMASAIGLDTPIPRPAGLPGTQGDRASSILLLYIDVALGIVGMVAVAFLIWGGFRYITSAGNDEVAEGAKKTIQNAIIGLVVIILSYVIVNVIISAIGHGQV